MATPSQIIETLERRGVTLKTVGENLEVTGVSKLTDAEKTTLRKHKHAFIQALERQCDKTSSNEAKLENFTERSAILEFDAGFSRREAEFRAFRLVWSGGSCTMTGDPVTVEEALEHARLVFRDQC